MWFLNATYAASSPHAATGSMRSSDDLLHEGKRSDELSETTGVQQPQPQPPQQQWTWTQKQLQGF